MVRDLLPDERRGAVEDVGRHLLAAARGEAVDEDRAGVEVIQVDFSESHKFAIAGATGAVLLVGAFSATVLADFV